MKVSVGYWGQIFSVAFVFFLNLDITSKKPLKEAKKKKFFFFFKLGDQRAVGLALGMGVEEWDWRQFPSFMLACYRDARSQGLPLGSAAHSPSSLWIFAPNNSRSAAKAGAFFSPQLRGLVWKPQLCPRPQ